MPRRFAESYESWEQTHDECRAIEKRARESSDTTGVQDPELQINRIRRMESQDELDLHEMILDDALTATRSFLDRSFAKGYRKVRIISVIFQTYLMGSLFRPQQMITISMQSGYQKTAKAYAISIPVFLLPSML